MTTTHDWEWRVGFLNGVGEALWQQLNDQVRRVTKIMLMPDGRALLVKSAPQLFSVQDDPQFDAAGFVAASTTPKDQQIEDVKKVWGMIMMPSNGKRIIS